VTEAFSIRPPELAVHRELLEGAWRTQRLREVVPIEQTFWRVVRATSHDEASRFATQLYPSPRLARFTPVLDRAGSAIVPAAYAGATAPVALWEVILREARHRGIRRLDASALVDRYLVPVRTTRALELIALIKPRTNALAALHHRPPDLSEAWPSAYAVTRAWSQFCYVHLPEAQGLVWESHHTRGECLLIWDRGREDAFELYGDPQRVTDGAARKTLLREADTGDVAVDFGALQTDCDEEG
jgi:hypothetical protein